MSELGRTVQYVTVSPLAEGGFRIVSGHRRVRAARELGWDWLPVIVVDDVADSADRRLRQIAENSARAALKPIELCEAIDQLRAEVEPARIAGATGVSLRTVYNYLGILQHPDLVDALREGQALRGVLAVVAARNRAAEAGRAAAGADGERARRQHEARRTAKRSVASLREVWSTLDEEQRLAMAEELRALLASASAPATSTDAATLHDSRDLRGGEFGLAPGDRVR